MIIPCAGGPVGGRILEIDKLPRGMRFPIKLMTSLIVTHYPDIDLKTARVEAAYYSLERIELGWGGNGKFSCDVLVYEGTAKGEVNRVALGAFLAACLIGDNNG